MKFVLKQCEYNELLFDGWKDGKRWFGGLPLDVVQKLILEAINRVRKEKLN